MVRKVQRDAGDDPGANDDAGGAGGAADANAREKLASTVRESASQIWLAGLGAFAKAQQEGSKVFETLVKEGLTLQRRTQSAAEERLSEATSRMASMASDLSSRASGQWDKLEGVFEQRVSGALNRLGVPSAKDVADLSARIDELARSVERLGAARGAAARPARTPRAGTGAARPATRKRAARKSP